MDYTTSNIQQMYETEVAEKLLLSLAYRNAKQAETVSQVEYWEPIDSIKAIYGTYEKAPVAPDQADDKNFKVKINDVADKTDEMFALVKKLLTGREDRKCIAYSKSDEKDVETTRKTQDAMLREGNFEHEKSLSALRFIKYHFSGLKVCRVRERTYKTERVTVPVMGVPDPFTGLPIPGSGFTSQDLLFNGYPAEDVQSGEAVRDKLAQQGLRFQGFADEFPQADTNGNPIYTQLLCTKTVEAWKDIVVGKAIDPRKLGICDMNRVIGRQASTHEFNYYTIPELSKCYPYNLDYFREKAEKAKADQQFPGTANVTSDQGGQGSDDYPIYQVIESWMDLDFQNMIDTGKLTEADLQGLAKKFKFPVQEFFVPGKWCIIHNLDRVLVDLYPSYLWDRDEFPYDIESWEPNEDRFCSRGFIHRISSAAAAVNKFRNFVMKNMRRMLNQSRLVAKRLQINPISDLDKLDEENGTVQVPGSAADLEKDVRFYEPPDATGPGFNMIRYFEGMISQLGPPAAIVGEGDAETATQADINDQRGQTIVNESFGRFVEMLMRFYKKHMGAMLISVTRGRMIKAAGEDGAGFRETWVTPANLTDRMEIVPMISFNDLQEERQSQFLIAMMNVFGQFLMPQEVRAIWKVCMRKGGLSTTDIEEVEGSLGSFTDVKQEVDAMLMDPNVFPKVQMDDPHPMCIMVASMALNQRLMEYQMMGLQPAPQFTQNLMQYIGEHQAAFEQQKIMAQLMTPQDGPEGKPKNEPPRKPGSKSEAREGGQEASPADSGMMTAGGLTGMGAV